MRRFRGFHQTPIARALPTGSLHQWAQAKPTMEQADEHLARIIACVPESWRPRLERKFAHTAPPLVAAARSVEDVLHETPEWARAWDMMQALADFEDEYGDAGAWLMSDEEIRDLARRLADDVTRTDNRAQARGVALETRLDDVRRFVRLVGVVEDKPIAGQPAIERAKDPLWWRRRLRTRVARTVEAGAVRMGLVHKGTGGYVSNDALQRRQAQLRRNAATLDKTLIRNEAGQVYTLAELARLGTANPEIRGGELMTRIRGAEEYADARAHVGLFVTLTLPSRFHAVTQGKGGRVRANSKYAGTSPRDGQLWLRSMWAKVRARLQRLKVRVYGLRVAEPHHDATPHWHMLIWAEDEACARLFEQTVRHYWLSDDGHERGAQQNRVNVKRMVKGGAAGYVAKYIAKSVGHVALAEHLDVVNGMQLTMDFGQTEGTTQGRVELAELQPTGQGHTRVDAWAAHWGIRQFQTIGMPSVTVWRELRRVSPDQLELFELDDRQTLRAWRACHRHGDIRADWREYMEAMGGHALPRKKWHLTCARRPIEEGQCNRYGDELKPSQGKCVGVCPQRGRMRGRWLVSRRIAWEPVARLPEAEAEAQQAIRDREAGVTRAALPPAWTGFNNCTARISGGLKYHISGHEEAEWIAADAHARAAPAWWE